MSFNPDEIAVCESCKGQMNIAGLAPFTSVNCPTCGEPTRVKVDLAQYQLTRRHGHGGMSLVFAAKDKNLGREVAIKILNEQYSMDTVRISQFEQEAKITAGVSHPNVVRVYTVGQAFNRYYIAMEMISGEALEEIMAEKGALPEEFVLPKMLQVTEGLNAAYSAGLIHRDMKPGNILIDNLGMAKIVDFGLALVTQGGVAKTDEIWATPYYVPPETLAREPEDFRSDIYALSVTMYHALAGKPPFEAESRSIGELAELKKSLPKLKEIAPHLSDCTCALIDKGMAHNPEERFGSYEEMLQALQYAEDHIGVEGATLPHFRTEAPASRLQNKLKILAPVILGLIFLTVGGYFILKFTEAENDVDELTHEPVEFKESTGVVEVDEKLRKSIEIGYENLEKSLETASYVEARETAIQVYALPKHPEPSKTLSGIHGIVASYLAGDLKGMREDGRHIYQDIQERGRRRNNNAFIHCYTSLVKLGPVNTSEVKYPNDRQADALFIFLAGLKNLEIGEYDLAGSQFEDFMQRDLSETGKHSDIFSLYQKISKDYLFDIIQLKSVNGEVFEALNQLELQELQERVSQLDFKTNVQRGPWVKKNILKNCKMLLETLDRRTAAEEVKERRLAKRFEFETLVEALESLTDMRSERDYQKIIQRLNQIGFKNPEEREKLEQYKYVCQNAAYYLQSFAKEDSKAFIANEIENVEGLIFRIVGVSENGLSVDREGVLRELKWSEIDPESLLGIYNSLIEGVESEREDELTEYAICYARMNNLEEQASSGAKVLAERSPEFAHRWEQMISVLRK